MAATVSLAHMVDLALGTPEVGAVNFNVLHALLHAMLSKLNLSAVMAEMSKEDSDLLASDSGRGTTIISDGDSADAKDGTTEIEKGTPTASTGVVGGRTPYHVLQKKVASLEEQMEKLNQLPSNPDLFERAKPVGDGERPRPISDMWQNVQIKNRVDANEEGIGKLMSLVEDLMGEMAKLKDDSANLRKDLENHNIPGLRSDVDDLKKKLEELDIDALRDFMAKLKKELDELTNKMNDMTDMDELRKRLKDLENLTNDLNDRLSAYPPIEKFEDFVTWSALEEALKGLRDELEPKDKIVIEMQTQTSRPSSAKNGPSEELKAMLEKLGILTGRHEALDGRVVKLEEEMPNKADKSDLDGLSSGPTGIPDDLVNQLKHLQDQLKALSKAREKLSELEEKLSQLPDFAGMEENIDGLNMGQGDLQRMIESLRNEYENNMSALEDKISSLQDLAMNAGVEPEIVVPPPRTPSPPVKFPPIPGASPPPDNSGKLSDLEKALRMKEAEMKALQQKMKWLMQDTNKQVTDLKDRLKNVDKELLNLINQKKPTSPVHIKSNDMVRNLQPITTSNANTSPIDMTSNHSDDELPDSQTNLPRHRVDANRSSSSIFKIKPTVPSLPTLRPFSPPKPLPPIVPANSDADKQDSEALTRMQQIVLQLQAELDRIGTTAQGLIDDNNNKTKQIDNLIVSNEKLERVKADKEYVQSEVDVKADKRLVENKVNRSLFDQTTDELNRLIKEMLDKLSGQEDIWKSALGDINEDVDGKLDRLEFGPIRDELERRLRALARQLKELSLRDGDIEDDAAGIKKQLLRFNCISCDRAVDMTQHGPIPSIPAPGCLPATRSSRPYTTFELEQIRQHARSTLQKGLRNASNFERAVLERQFVRCRMHNGGITFITDPTNYGVFEIQNREQNANPEPPYEGNHLQQPGVEVVDLYATSRACGGSHTMTHPHRRITRVTQYNNLFRDEGEAPPSTKEELDIQGADGHIYKGRLDARLPTTLQQSAPNMTGPQPSSQPPKMSRVVYHQPVPRPPQTAPAGSQSQRPTSARTIKPMPSVPTADGPAPRPTSPPN